MSAKNRKKKSKPKEDYFTPAWCVRRLLEAVSLPAGRWLEPMAGAGHLVKAVMDNLTTDVSFTTVELQSKYIPQLKRSGAIDVTQGNIFKVAQHYPWQKDRIGLPVWIGNPAFSLTEKLVKLGYEMKAQHIVLLLRLNWLGSDDRQEWLSKHMPDVYVLPNRPGFESKFGKTDATEYAWMHWKPPLEGCVSGRTSGNIKLLKTTSLKERRDDHRAIRYRRRIRLHTSNMSFL